MMIRRANGNVIRQRHDAAPNLFVDEVCWTGLRRFRNYEIAADEDSTSGAEISDG
jgi:hypothetical protein